MLCPYLQAGVLQAVPLPLGEPADFWPTAVASDPEAPVPAPLENRRHWTRAGSRMGDGPAQYRPVSELACPFAGLAMQRLAVWSLFALVFSIPWDEAVAFQEIGTLSRLLGYATLALGFVVVTFRGTTRGFGAPHAIVVSFIAWSVYTTSWSVAPEETWSRVLVYFRMAGLAWLIWEVAAARAEQVKLMQAYVLGCGVSVVAVFLAAWRETEFVSSAAVRFTGAGMNHNDLACILALSIPMALHLGSRSRESGELPWPHLLYSGCAVLAILYTGSRTGLIVLGIGLVLMATVHQKGRLKTGLYLATLLVGILFLSQRVLPEALQSRLAGTGEELMQGSWSERRDILAAAWPLVEEEPLTGFGAGTFREAMYARVGWAVDAHSTYLNLLIGTGLVGVLLFLALPSLLLTHTFHLVPSERHLWLTLLLMWAVTGLSATWDGTKTTWFLMGLGFSWTLPVDGSRNRPTLRFPRPLGRGVRAA